MRDLKISNRGLRLFVALAVAIAMMAAILASGATAADAKGLSLSFIGTDGLVIRGDQLPASAAVSLSIRHSAGSLASSSTTTAQGRFLTALFLPTADGRAEVTATVAGQVLTASIGDALPAPTFNSDGVKVNSLTVSSTTAPVGGNVSASYSIQTNKPITFAYLVAAVRDSRNIDGPSLDFTNERAVTVNGEHRFTSSRSWSAAEAYVVHVAYSIDGTNWVHFNTPSAKIAVGGNTATTTVPPTTSAPSPVTTLYPSGTRWASGAGGNHADTADPARFGAWRGEPVTYGTVWTYPEGFSSREQVGVTEFTKRGYQGIINMSTPWPQGSTWSQAANGGLDAYWTSMVDTIVEDWGQTRQVQLSFAYEFNGTWMPWSINGQVSDFGKAWKRMYNIVQARKAGKDIKVVLNFSYGPQSGAGATIDQMVQAAGVGYFDILGVDVYDAWLPDGNDGNIRTQAEWDMAYMLNAGSLGPRGVGAWLAYARSLGKPISFPEWGLSDRRDVPIADNPFFIEKMNQFFRSIAPADPFRPAAGQLAGEAFFNTWDQSQVYPSTKVPNAAAKYQALRWGV